MSGQQRQVVDAVVDRFARGGLLKRPSIWPAVDFIDVKVVDVIGKYRRFMPIAQAFAAMSKYPGTRVGAVVLGPGYEMRASGWNGAPRGCRADEDGRLDDRDERLMWATHAEANAIANAARTGTALMGSTMVVTHTPCMACAKSIVQAGITRVISPAPDADFERKWAEDFKRTRALFEECGVHFIEFVTTESKE